MSDPTVVPPAMNMQHGRRRDCMDHALNQIMFLPECVEGTCEFSLSQ